MRDHTKLRAFELADDIAMLEISKALAIVLNIELQQFVKQKAKNHGMPTYIGDQITKELVTIQPQIHTDEHRYNSKLKLAVKHKEITDINQLLEGNKH